MIEIKGTKEEIIAIAKTLRFAKQQRANADFVLVIPEQCSFTQLPTPFAAADVRSGMLAFYADGEVSLFYRDGDTVAQMYKNEYGENQLRFLTDEWTAEKTNIVLIEGFLPGELDKGIVKLWERDVLEE
ncbi:MAG: hypothetical protein LBN00_03780 [Oscillospiraceae bacterium]|jgi:hypothetical protein|nr:hypothetical protein [Oscillospiraceae bacterium]